MRSLIPLAVLLLVAAPIVAQTPTPGIGLGVGMDINTTSGATFDIDGASGRTGTLLVPITVSPNLRIEPTIGLLRLSTSQSSRLGEQFQTQEGRFTFWQVGVGLLYTLPVSDRVRTYVGPRLGLARLTSSVRTESSFDPDGPRTSSLRRIDTQLAGVFGGEYFVASRFSVGVEARITYTRMGDTDVDEEPAPPPEFPEPEQSSDGSAVETSGQLAIRWYLGG